MVTLVTEVIFEHKKCVTNHVTAVTNSGGVKMARLSEGQKKNVHLAMHVFPGSRLIIGNDLVDLVLMFDPMCSECVRVASDTKAQSQPLPVRRSPACHPSPHVENAPVSEHRSSIVHQDSFFAF